MQEDWSEPCLNGVVLESSELVVLLRSILAEIAHIRAYLASQDIGVVRKPDAGFSGGITPENDPTEPIGKH